MKRLVIILILALVSILVRGQKREIKCIYLVKGNRIEHNIKVFNCKTDNDYGNCIMWQDTLMDLADAKKLWKKEGYTYCIKYKK
jgi:hypothetical protein